MGFSSSKNSKINKIREENKATKVCIKGILYDKKTNKIIYEGDLVDGKCEGKGKYIFENGDYYIGNFSNGVREGLGNQYYKNNELQYEGKWKSDMRNGHGLYYYENGDYFIGFWRDNKKFGKGELYDKNGQIIKEGDVCDINTEESNMSINLNNLILK